MESKLFNFNNGEAACIQRFDTKFAGESELLFRLFNHLESLITQLNKKIRDTDFPDWTIEIFLANNLTLLYNSFDRLRKGYFGISLSLIRPVVESIALAMYFFEFPKDEKLYRKRRKSFTIKLKNLGYNNWIEGVVHRVDKEGTKFAKGDPNIGQTWFNFLIRNLGEESSNFLHANPEYIFAVVYGGKGIFYDNYCLGPNWLGQDMVKNALWHIIEATLYNTIIFDRCFKKHITRNDFNLIEETVDKLNKWKNEYQALTTRNKK